MRELTAVEVQTTDGTTRIHAEEGVVLGIEFTDHVFVVARLDVEQDRVESTYFPWGSVVSLATWEDGNGEDC